MSATGANRPAPVNKSKETITLRRIPSVDRLVQEVSPTRVPRPLVVAIIRRELEMLRREPKIPGFESVLERVRLKIENCRLSRIQTVINGTGIVIHTNLGRSPLGEEVVRALADIATSYNNLEYDLVSGERGGRASYLEQGLALLCEAESATVVNNCAAALVLILRHFTTEGRKQVVISRGELVQIGGGFRIPEILEASGARLIEVGTTNKTTLEDYRKAISSETALLLKVHRSNFYMDGFVESPSTEELSTLARKLKIPLVEDLGSGAMVSPSEYLLEVANEPTPAGVLACGVDLVCFSGDKLMGGPQAGIIAGNESLVKALKNEPFFRALRCDKLILGALQCTVDLYLAGIADRHENRKAIPILEMMALLPDELRTRASNIVSSLREVRVRAEIGIGESRIGGGTLPRTRIPSVTIDLIPDRTTLNEFSARLRNSEPPVIGYISEGRLKLDLRTVFPRQDAAVIDAIRNAISQNEGS